MKYFSIILLIFFILAKCENYEDAHYLILDDSDTTIDGKLLGTNGVYYKEENGEVTIKSPGIYIVTGRLTGQLEINPEGENDTVTLVLDGVKITSSNSSAILFKAGYEFYQQNGTNNTGNITYEDARALNFSKVGAKIIIADDSINTIIGSHSEKHDGAISSKISLVIAGESKGNGVLNLVADTEGIEVKKHLLIDGGIINIASQDDGINTKADKVSACIIKRGEIRINAGLGKVGDGVDSNGFVIVEGGLVYASSQIGFESGLDGSLGLIINGGTVISLGSGMDIALSIGKQPTMNIKFAEQRVNSSLLKVKDSEGKEVFSFSPLKLGFMTGTEVRNYSAAIISSPSLKQDAAYYLYIDDVQYGNGGKSETRSRTPHGKPAGGRTPGGQGGQGGQEGQEGQGGQGGHRDFPEGGFPGRSRGGGFSGCDTNKTMNTTLFEMSYAATTFACVQEVPEIDL